MPDFERAIEQYINSERRGYDPRAVVHLMKRYAGLSADGACGLIQQWLDLKAEEIVRG